MAIIPQQTLFVWSEIEELGDLERLRMVIENMPDEELMEVLERERGKKGRDDYPVRAVWNTVLAGVVFQHPTIESLRRELSRNAQLRYMCGLYGSGKKAIPSEWAYTRFFKKLFKHEEEIEKMFNKLVRELKEVLPVF
jgi:transposase